MDQSGPGKPNRVIARRARPAATALQWSATSAARGGTESERFSFWLMDVGPESSLIFGSTTPIRHSALAAMRTLLEILVVVALVTLTWQKSIQDRVNDLTGRKPNAAVVTTGPATTTAPQPQLRPLVRATATPSGDWMWDPSRRSALDRPAYNPNQSSQSYQDQSHARYWIDSHGVRHNYDSSAPPP
jgi:hypothetical protein